ncbi:P-loop containing nucleoside triphosphate hydrolase protein [Gonapodya prolifera JEL478]|uniref:Nucleolar GTP-binding protein 1 n=1 Tax=Gonapodya prolifera (strain JEL478) TaxID=1344416 RepID=A0A139APA7_GONPJ|nr:P-loop containing nucleoside triphosphate hydrolase protein [Gonapodya prolifera JEL478]|eukprot:KXS18591.1 P-loop containing nucleoside triphosphate hydrolase protein [Gonapodya prolifera JEL478]
MGSSFYNFKRIGIVPPASDFIDITLSKIQRKTPTVVHPGYHINRIRQFYMRKVKFAQDCFDERLTQILTDFPKLDEIHPFYADLLNVLYDRDHYKLALGQINQAKHLIDNVAKDYVRLLKFGDSLYRCKQLKRAALGRMCTIMKRQKDSLSYLEQVRQHMARLPSIDPNTRTLLVCGYPNVGKSSFMNKLTRAQVDVQPYAFTTKSLFVGHMDYKYLRWQVIDTPGILDHPLEERNTIEMQSITALAHLRACILFFIDLSEQCGYSVKQQVALFHSIKPLFANKPTMVIVNKIDVRRRSDLQGEEKELVDSMLSKDGVEHYELSCYTEEGVMDARNKACDVLLQSRVEMKVKQNKVGDDVLNRLHMAVPQARDDKERPAFIPDEIIEKRKKKEENAMEEDEETSVRKLEKDIELENGGPGVYNIDLKKLYLYKNPEWKHDVIPEIMDGHNVADFFDEDIEERLVMLEREEERLEAEGFYDEEAFMADSDDEALEQAVKEMFDRKKVNQINARLGATRKGLPRGAGPRAPNSEDFKAMLKERGASVDASRGRSIGAKKRGRDDSEMEVDEPAQESNAVTRSKSRLQSLVRSRSKGASAAREPSAMGLKNKKQKLDAEKLRNKAQTQRNLHGRQGDADRHVSVKLPKHLFAGKRGIGKTDRR